MSVGWNPQFGNKHKTCEPWLLHAFHEDFYGQELRLLVTGYIRPEQQFEDLDALVERIKEDGRVAEKVLRAEAAKDLWRDPFLAPPATA